MKNKHIVIDAGHGGSDPGAIGNGIIEKDYTLLISNYIYDRLKSWGADVSIVRDKDDTLSPSQRVRKILDFYGNGDDVITISNHINAGGGDGAEIIYSLRNTNDLPKIIANELEKVGQNVRKYYQRRLPSNPSRDYYFILRDTANNESIIIEYGFVDNVNDANKLKNNWKNYAEAVAKAIASYIGLKADQNQIVVQSGDTLWSLAKKNNLTVNQLKEYNNLDNNLLSVGQVLYLTPKETSVTEDTYIVKSGDTLYKISKENNISVKELKQLNNLDNDSLIVGQILKVKKDLVNDNSTNYYVVQSGDNLYTISKKYNVAVNEIKQANGLQNDNLIIGQKLIIPTPKETYDVYIVKSGDTLYSIARLYNTTVTNIQTINNLDTSVLSIGQKLLVPKK